MMGNASIFYREIVSKSYKKWFPHSQYMISLLLMRGIPIESLYQQIPCKYYNGNQSVEISNYRDCGYTCNPRKFEIPALRFPRRDPVNPCKHLQCTDYGGPMRKLPSLQSGKSTPTPKFLGSTEAYFVCHIDPNFQISLIHAFIGCP